MTATTVLRRLTGRTNQPTAEYVGRHRADTIAPVDPGHGLTPAAYQTHTHTTDHVPAGADDATGLLDAAAIRSTSQWTVPAPDGARVAVLAEMRADLDDTAAARAEQALTGQDGAEQ
ncbi:hypothetical protein AB0875_12710 [Micromonospora gifhornensis]|uniref:hypothetical protein n=1 Tax=Micromonospora gifhornensis TaxID=84594 RepID=UPI00345124E9